MIRSLKILVLAALAVTAFAAVNASGAQAAEELFHCSVAPCTYTAKQDGTGTTGHHVFQIKQETGGAIKGSFTCKEFSGEGTASSKTVSEITLEKLVYSNCTIAGSAVTVDTEECHYLFFSAGGKVSVQCPAGKSIKLTVEGGCVVSIPGTVGPPARNQNLTGVKYHNIGAGATTEVTAEVNVTMITGTANAACKALLGFEGEFTDGEYTTGNTLITGETTPGVMAESWWA
jgi:hypothetical protein